MIDALKNSVLKDWITWSGYYIIAPENASGGNVTLEDWKQVWQYGSYYGQINADSIWDQPGRRSAWSGTTVCRKWYKRKSCKRRPCIHT